MAKKGHHFLVYALNAEHSLCIYVTSP